MKDGKYEFAEKFRDAKSSGMLDSNMGRVPARRHVERAAVAQRTPAASQHTGRLRLARLALRGALRPGRLRDMEQHGGAAAPLRAPQVGHFISGPLPLLRLQVLVADYNEIGQSAAIERYVA